ncbi:MAG: V-type ATP synthase subunit I [Clostridiaceae bacterium]|nr:V-type ATP synthase subunit I [Clostridiaceae bacterium]
MAIVKMDRLTIVGLEKDKNDIVEALTNLGAFEVISERGDDLSASEVATTDPDSRLAALQHDITRLERVIELNRTLHPEKKALFAGKRKVSEAIFRQAVSREDDLLAAVSRIEHNQATAAELSVQQHRLQAAQTMLEPWQDLDLDLAEEGTKSVCLFLCSADSADQVNQLREALNEDVPESFLHIAAEDENGLRLVVAAWRPRASVVQGHLRRLNFNPLPLQGEKGTPRQQMDANAGLLAANEAELDRIQRDNIELTRDGKSFEILYDALTIRYDRLKTVSSLSGTQKTFWMEGWVPFNLVAEVTKGLERHFLVATAHRPAAADEEFPILFNNRKLVKPYEVVVEMFGPPCCREVDPTPVMAPFFFIFFGIMLSDVGYGLILVALCAWLTFKVKPSGELGRLSRMFLLSGVSAVTWGFIFGGYFGNIISVLSGQTFDIPPIWFNPMNDPIQLLLVSVVLGVIHLFAGLGVQAYMLFKTNRAIDAILDIFPIYALIIGLALLVLVEGPVGMILTIAALAVMVLFGGRESKNPVLRILNGLMSIYNNLAGYLGDILSYTRVLALVMATSVIAMVFNLLGFIGGPTFGGILLFIPVALIGHTLNLSLSALSAYVHTSRLQYVEFFGKFYEGSGRIWRPLDWKTRFIEIGTDAAEEEKENKTMQSQAD